MPADLQVHVRLADLKIAQDHLVEKGRQSRVAQVDLVRSRLELQAERCLNQRERRRAGPGLRCTGNGVERWPAPALALESTKQFRQAPPVHIGCSLEQPARDLRHRTFQAVTRKSERN